MKNFFLWSKTQNISVECLFSFMDWISDLRLICESVEFACSLSREPGKHPVKSAICINFQGRGNQENTSRHLFPSLFIHNWILNILNGMLLCVCNFKIRDCVTNAIEILKEFLRRICIYLVKTNKRNKRVPSLCLPMLDYVEFKQVGKPFSFLNFLFGDMVIGNFSSIG